jgi:hypothetical protein
MGAFAADGIAGIAARYAAQIDELLYVRAIERMAAEQEATRQQAAAERAARIEAAKATKTVEEPVKVDVEPETGAMAKALPDPIRLPEPAANTEAATTAPAQLIDIQA